VLKKPGWLFQHPVRVLRGDQDGIVHGEAGVLPGEELAGEVLVDEPLLHEVPHHPPAEAFGQACCILDWKMMKDAGSVNASLQRQGMPVWIEAEHIPEGLVRDDNARAHIRPGCLSAILAAASGGSTPSPTTR